MNSHHIKIHNGIHDYNDVIIKDDTFDREEYLRKKNLLIGMVQDSIDGVDPIRIIRTDLSDQLHNRDTTRPARIRQNFTHHDVHDNIINNGLNPLDFTDILSSIMQTTFEPLFQTQYEMTFPSDTYNNHAEPSFRDLFLDSLGPHIDDIFSQLFTNIAGLNATVSPIPVDHFDTFQKLNYNQLSNYMANIPEDKRIDIHKDCPICKDDFKPDSSIIILPECHHHFDEACIRRWMLEMHYTCPLCRHNYQPPY